MLVLLFCLYSRYDILEYGTGAIIGDNVLGECSGNEPPAPLSVPTSLMWFRFTSDSSLTYRGFVVNWNTISMYNVLYELIVI